MGAFSVVDLFLQRRQDGTTTAGGGPTGGGATGGEDTPTGGGTTVGGGATSPGGGTTAAGDPSPTGGSTGTGDSPPGGGTAGGTGTDAPPTGGATSPPVGGGTTVPPDGGTATPPGGTATAPGGGTATLTDGGSNTSGAGTAIPTDGGSNTSGAGTGTPTDGGSNTSEVGTGIPTDGGSNTSGTSTPPITTTTRGGDTTTTPIPLPVTTTRRTSWDVTSTWCPPELSKDPQYAAQPTFTGTTVIDGTSWVQTTLDAPLTTVYTTESIYTEHGQAMTKYIPVTTVIPPGTVVIRHNLTVGKKSSKVPIVAGALGGVAALILIGALAFFLAKRRQRREAARNLRIDIDPTTPAHNPPYPGLPPLMSETTGNSQLLRPSATGSTNYGGVVGAQYNAVAYGATSRPPMDTTSMGGASSMYASTNYGRSTSPNIVGAQQMHYRSPSAASGGSVPVHQVAPSMTSHVSMAHYRAESGSTPIGIVQEEDPLLGPFSDSNRVPTPSSVMPLVHEDAGSIRNAEVGVWSPPAYDGAGSSRM